MSNTDLVEEIQQGIESLNQQIHSMIKEYQQKNPAVSIRAVISEAGDFKELFAIVDYAKLSQIEIG